MNITDKSIIVIPVTQELNDTEVDNLEVEQPEQGNNQQADKETMEQDERVVIVDDDEVTTIQHSSKYGGDEECENHSLYFFYLTFNQFENWFSNTICKR